MFLKEKSKNFLFLLTVRDSKIRRKKFFLMSIIRPHLRRNKCFAQFAGEEYHVSVLQVLVVFLSLAEVVYSRQLAVAQGPVVT